MSKTIDNLGAAFAGESQANRKYLLFAEKAEKAVPRCGRCRDGARQKSPEGYAGNKINQRESVSRKRWREL
jgi:hypothetical protein